MFTNEQISSARDKANLLALAEIDTKLFEVSGGEYRGPCPFCGKGTDRFVVFADNGRFACRQCKKKGDSLQYLIYRNGWSFTQAVKYANGVKVSTPSIKQINKPVQPTFNAKLWRANLELMLYKAVDCLAKQSTDNAADWLKWLSNRGIGYKAAITYGLGYNDQWRQIYGTYKLYPGLLLPRFKNEINMPLMAVNVYLDKQYVEKYGRRRFVRNSFVGTAIGEHMITDNTKAIWICEGELDAVLLSQFLPVDHVAISYGGASNYPDDLSLLRGHTVYICMDNDDAGRNAEKQWLEKLPDSIVLSMPDKDITDMWGRLGDNGLQQWIFSSLCH